MRKLIFSTIVLVSFLANSAEAQIDRTGFNIGLGLGTGFSAHAAAFEEVVDTTFNLIKDYGGYRILLADFRVGWGFSKSFSILYTAKYSPPNSTVSPYQSFYQGAIVSISPTPKRDLMFDIGVGLNQAFDKSEKLANGTLINLGFGYEFSPKFLLTTTTMFGNMDPRQLEGKFFTSDGEFFFQATLNYLFYPKAVMKEDR